MKYFIYLFFGIIFFSLLIHPIVTAQELANNKYGIHLAQPDPNDLERAAELVNSHGGDWGYVTLVMQENDRDRNKWQSIFEHLRKLHLIPIIRLATQPEGAVWRRPQASDAEGWVNFLNSLNWVVKKRYVILFNEPNHAGEWGGSVDSSGYADVAFTFAQKLKSGNEDFVIMLAGFDASAPSARPQYEDEETFIRTIFREDRVEEWNTLLSGWSSHSYPNPAFSGSPADTGRGTVRTYQWELDLLKSLGVKELPVFITETGWDASAVGQDQAARNMRTTYIQTWFSDARIQAITPFLLNYQTAPFIGFSWMNAGTTVQPVYTTIQELPKTSGKPELIERGVLRAELPSEIVTESLYRFPLVIRNTGQSVWDVHDGYKVVIEGLDPKSYYVSDLEEIYPFEEAQIYLYAQTLDESIGTKQATVALYQDDRKVKDLTSWKFEVLPLPQLKFKVRVFPAMLTDSSEYELQIFDQDEQIVYKRKDITVDKSIGLISNIPNIVLEKQYRVVLLRPYYLPRQTFIRFKKGTNEVTFPWMLPIDMNTDGKLDRFDIMELMKRQGNSRS